MRQSMAMDPLSTSRSGNVLLPRSGELDDYRHPDKGGTLRSSIYTCVSLAVSIEPGIASRLGHRPFVRSP